MSATTPTPQWTDVEHYRQLLQQYTLQSDAYDRMLVQYREQETVGAADPKLKQQLEQDFAQIQDLYAQLSEIRASFAKARDAKAAVTG
jgi:hypothetical protein